MSESGKIMAYRIVRQLGKGGMGVVWEVESPEGERLALKLFASTGAHADFLRKRFVAEGKILSKLSSERLVSVRETGYDSDSGAPYFTMDLVLGADGEPCTLESLRRRGGLKPAATIGEAAVMIGTPVATIGEASFYDMV